MNPFKGLGHMVKIYGGGQLQSTKPKRPAGMSGRQWKRARKALSLTTRGNGFTRKPSVVDPQKYAAKKVSL